MAPTCLRTIQCVAMPAGHRLAHTQQRQAATPTIIPVTDPGIAIASRLRDAVRRRPNLEGDFTSLLSRPCFAEVHDRVSAALTHHGTGPRSATYNKAVEFLEDVDACLTKPRIKRLVNTLEYVSCHTSTYAVLGMLEAALDEDDKRVTALAQLLTPLMEPAQLAELSGCITTEQLGKAIDRLPEAVEPVLDDLLCKSEAVLEKEGGRMICPAFYAARLVFSLRAPQKAMLALMLLAADGRSPLPSSLLELVLFVALLAVVPVQLVPWVVEKHLAALRPMPGTGAGHAAA